MTTITSLEIRRWKRLKNGYTFIGKLYRDGIYIADTTLSTHLIQELHDRFVLRTPSETFTLMKSYERKQR